jgi:hypothetical protein
MFYEISRQLVVLRFYGLNLAIVAEVA